MTVEGYTDHAHGAAAGAGHDARKLRVCKLNKIFANFLQNIAINFTRKHTSIEQATNATMSSDEETKPSRKATFNPKDFAINPTTSQVIKKSGPTYARLVKCGVIKDAEFVQAIQEKALARKKAMSEKIEQKKAAAPKKAPPKAKAVRAARKHIESNRSELDGLESDAVVENLVDTSYNPKKYD